MSHAKRRGLGAFIHLSLDGYYCDAKGDMGFAHKPPDDEEWQTFVKGNASGDSVLVFGRRTYDMMAAWWPTPAAAQAMPEVAARMNGASKVVFSRTMTSAAWQNTTLIAEDAVAAIRRMKEEPGPDMTILGSGSLVGQLAGAGLVDTLQVVVNPIALGGGQALFAGLTRPLDLALTGTRVFRNGAVVLWYAPR